MNQSSFTFSKVLSGAYKTLGLANQIIPLYQQVSPMVKNAKSAFSVLKNFNKNTKVNTVKPIIKKNIKSEKKELSLNNPVFFH